VYLLVGALVDLEVEAELECEGNPEPPLVPLPPKPLVNVGAEAGIVVVICVKDGQGVVVL